MSEHEMLKKICDKIGYTNGFNHSIDIGYLDFHCTRRRDIREIIFTQEFMDKFIEYKYPNAICIDVFCGDLILSSLNNPVKFLYNLIK